jgi:soluble lytic murein transglycosylase-like protein
MDRWRSKMALAAYNAGKGARRAVGGVPPFPETVNYLQRVSYTTRYRQRVRNRYVAALRMHTALAE